ncbi:MAG: RtcB family protein [Candidatus Helarchaeota archaeon]
MSRRHPRRRGNRYRDKSFRGGERRERPPFDGPIDKIADNIYEISETFRPGMRVPSRIYCDDVLLEKMKKDNTLTQATNITFLPGIYKFSITLPDGHSGYGFPIGGVAATDLEEGVVSPGGVGYDINCGVRLLRTNLQKKELTNLKELMELLFRSVPSGLGSKGKLRLTVSELDKVLQTGTEWAIERGYGWEEDAIHTENAGCIENANPSLISGRAKERGLPQLGSLGSGNHFLEIQYVDKIYNSDVATKLGIKEEGQIMVMIHTGSRGFGHQVCSDFLRIMERSVRDYDIKIPDRELACAPIKSKEGQQYLQSMACAANFAWVNRQMIMHWVRESFEKLFHQQAEDLDMHLLYDVAHNIAKIEMHEIEGKKVKVCVHRKGATRAFPAEHPEVNKDYRSIGQPVLLPGSMGTASYLLIGGNRSMELSFGSTAHGAGRVLSRSAATRKYWGEKVQQELMKEGMVIKAASKRVLSEEAPGVYKDIDRVANVSHNLGIATKIVRLRPFGVTKG